MENENKIVFIRIIILWHVSYVLSVLYITQWTLIVKIKFSQQHFLYMFSWSPGWWLIGFNFLETMQTKIIIILNHIFSSIILIYSLFIFRSYNEIQKEAKLSRNIVLEHQGNLWKALMWREWFNKHVVQAESQVLTSGAFVCFEGCQKSLLLSCWKMDFW